MASTTASTSAGWRLSEPSLLRGCTWKTAAPAAAHAATSFAISSGVAGASGRPPLRAILINTGSCPQRFQRRSRLRLLLTDFNELAVVGPDHRQFLCWV